MKRARARATSWSDKDDDSSSSSDSDAESDDDMGDPKKKLAQVSSGGKKSGAIDFEALKRHGYKGGLSVLKVPPPKEDVTPDWTWSTGREHREAKVLEESSEEQQKTRTAVAVGEQVTNFQTQKEKEKKNLSFSQKEKRKRELGQASRGKSYVEEEKRLLRESGIYSGFDS